MLLKTPIGILEIICSHKGLCSINGNLTVCKDHNVQNLPVLNSELHYTDRSLIKSGENDDRQDFAYKENLEKRVAAWVERYFVGEETEFPKDIPLDVEGTEFQRRVWDELRQIPYGKTRTYGEIAVILGEPGAARAVGSACGKNPILLAIPCHRVVGASGLGGFALGLDIKKKLLNLEVSFAG